MTVLTKTGIPLVDLKATYRTIRDEVRTAIDDVLEGVQLNLGPNATRTTAPAALQSDGSLMYGWSAAED